MRRRGVARELETLNARRQALDQAMLDDAITQADALLAPDDRGLVLASAEWHPGVIGIVASRLVERYGRPTFLIAWDGDVGKGSGRSVAGLDLHAALQAGGPAAREVRRARHGGGPHDPARALRGVSDCVSPA